MAAWTVAELRGSVVEWAGSIPQDSPLYARLAASVASNDEVLEILQAVPAGQIHMNLLLAAVQYLLVADPAHPLAQWYPSLGGSRTDGDLEDHFAAFVLERRTHIAELIAVRRVQTNEVARCCFLLPAYNLVNRLSGLPIALIEVGSSAGLNQNVDRYHYRYESETTVVETGIGSVVKLTCHTGATVPAEATGLPDIGWRRGLDTHPVDVTDPDQARWLKALVWADQVTRHERLAAALEVARQHKPIIVRGDALGAVRQLVAQAPPEMALVVQHSFVINQLSRTDRARFAALLDRLAGEVNRPIYRIGAEWYDLDRVTILELTVHGPDPLARELALVHFHGAWIDWLHTS